VITYHSPFFRDNLFLLQEKSSGRTYSNPNIKWLQPANHSDHYIYKSQVFSEFKTQPVEPEDLDPEHQ
jgi:hypothetical protein